MTPKRYKTCAYCKEKKLMWITSICCSYECSAKYRTEEKPACAYCGNPVKTSRNKTCSKKCARLLAGPSTDLPSNVYRRQHLAVERQRGKASKCVNGCISKVYHWANISGNYDDPMDFQEMCPKCHKALDREKVG